jgi:hypothetical protein
MPVAFALTAGSLGDIQGVITLLCKLGQAVYDANDTSRDYQELKEEWCAFRRVLLEVEKVQDSIPSQSAVDSLASEIAQCQADLQNFLEKHPMQSRWNKIKWAFGGNSAAASLRETLMRHRQIVQILLATYVALWIFPIHNTEKIILGRFFCMIDPSGSLSRICTQLYNKEWRQCVL